MDKTSKIFNIIREILHKNYAIQRDEIQLEARFEIELAVDSREMFELMEEFEEVFNIEISYDEIDAFIFDKNTKKMTVQNAVSFIYSKIKEKQK